VIHGGDQPETIEKTVWFIDSKKHKIQNKKKVQKTNTLKGKLIITEIGIKVIEFLNKYFEHLLDESYTSKIEDKLDNVANGSKVWYQVVDKFYQQFHPQVLKLDKTSGPQPTRNKKDVKTFGELDGYTYSIVKTRYGNTFVKQNTLDKQDIQYLPIVSNIFHKGMSVDIKQLQFIFSLPQNVGNGIELYYGRNGFYIKKGEKSSNLNGNIEYNSIPSLDELQDKLDSYSETQTIKSFKDYKILQGKYGPCILYKNRFYKIPRTLDPQKLTLTECKKIISNSKK
jgi:DNA topoisomerase-1